MRTLMTNAHKISSMDGEAARLLTDEELGDVASELGNLYFRAGLLLGLQPHQLERLEVDARQQGLTVWQMNMQVLQAWKERTSAALERSELAKVLKKLNKGRLALQLDSSVTNFEEKSVIDASNESLSVLELEEVSRGVCECWRLLAVHLRLPDTRVRTTDVAPEEISVKAFRCLWAWREAGVDVSKASLARALIQVNKSRLAHQIWPACFD